MLICIDAGHGLGTAGKRCLRAIDKQETREWVLNDRIADRVQKLLTHYDVRTMRADDTTGKTDVPLASRVKKANSAGASLFLSIHHNAGIKGGKGGGIVVYTAPGCSEQSKVVQEAVYRYTVATTGLRGNRAEPLAESSLYVLRNTKMPAVLGEFGFMDSTTDTPIILTEEYADQVAGAITAALAEVYGWEEVEEMLDEKQIRRIVREEMAAIEAERAKLPAESWAVPHIQGAVDHGLMAENAAGSIDRPQAAVTRQELATVADAIYKAVK